MTLQKKTDSEMSLANNANLLAGILGIVDETSGLYGVESFRQTLIVKTAVGTAGIIEAILPYIPVFVISIICLTRMLLGKAKGPDGLAITSIMAIITKIDEMINDHHNRKKTDAETEKILAEAKRIAAEKRKVEAEARKIDTEASLMRAPAEKVRMETSLAEVQVEKRLEYSLELQDEKVERLVAERAMGQIEEAYENLVCANDEIIR